MAITAVQRVSNAAIGATSAPIDSGVGWATPTAGNLLVITYNLDVTMTLPSGWTAGPSVVDDSAAYLFYKIAAGTESSIAPTFASTNPVATGCEYAGVTGTPFDAQNTSAITLSAGNTTTSTSVTTTAAGDLVFAAATLFDFNAPLVAAPDTPVWTNSFTNVLSQNIAPSTGKHGHTFIGELLVAGAAGSYGTSCSWSTGSMDTRHELVIAFKAAAAAAVNTPPVVVSQAINRSYTY